MEKLSYEEISGFALAYVDRVKTPKEIINTNAFYVVLWVENGRTHFNELPNYDQINSDTEAELIFKKNYDINAPTYLAIVVFDHLSQKLLVRRVF